MFKNHLKIAGRNLWKNKTFTALNVIGLTIGLTSFLLIALYIFDELTYDRLHKHTSNIYRVIENKTFASGKTARTAGAGYQVSERAKTGIPEIKDFARYTLMGRANVVSGDDPSNVFYEDFIVATPSFFTVFSFPLLHGDRNTALSAPNSIVITEETSKKYFGTSNSIGKFLLITDRDSVPFKVTGILKNFPANSSIGFNLIASEATILKNEFTRKFVASDWTSSVFATYFLLQDKHDIPALDAKLNQLFAANNKTTADFKRELQLQALADAHFYSAGIEGFTGRKGNISYIYVFMIVACFIIFIACINYMNLSTARFSNRSKEIAVRKVSGASRTNLTKQFLTEALLVSVISIVLSIGLINLLLPPFNAFTEKQLSVGFNTDYRIWIGICAVLVIVTLVAGLYPALFQSGLNPLSLLKSRIQLNRGNISLRRGLVIFQFAVSIVLIAATIILYQQMQYVNQKDLGFDNDKVVVIDINSGKVRRAAATIKNEFTKLAQVKSAAVTSRVPGEWKSIPSVKVSDRMNNAAAEKDMYFIAADDQFLSTYDITLLNGRNFFSSGTADSSAVLLNETAAKELGITNAEGQLITIPSVNFGGDYDKLDQPFVASVAGIVKDFNFQSLHEPLAPMILGFQKNPVHNIDYFTVKLSGGNIEETVKQIDAILNNIDQSHLFEYHFLDKQWELLYREDRIRQTIFLVIALLAIAIAALGLLGLTIYAAEQRVKEIGIRKVLGASVGSVVFMLSKDFLKLVLIASVIAVPVAWFFMNKWLQDFAYRIDIEWWVFILSAFAAVLIAMATISFQAIKAATVNPVRSLKTE